MSEAVGFGFAAVFGFGWLLTLGLVSRSIVPMANGFKIHQAIVDREDAKVFSLTERALKLRNHGAPLPKDEVARPTGGGPLADMMQAGTVGVTPFIGPQPDAGEEIME